MGLLDKMRRAVVNVVAEAMVIADSRKPAEVSSAVVNRQPVEVEEPTTELKADLNRLPSEVSAVSPKNDQPTSIQPLGATAILRLLGAAPAERPFYELFGEREEDERPTGKMSEQRLNDLDFSNWLKSYDFKIFSVKADRFDAATQLPVFQLDKQGFYPVASRYGANLSMVSERLTHLDFAMAKLGWVRYVVHSSGPKIPDSAHENIEAAGTIWEGYVPLTRSASTQAEQDAARQLLRDYDQRVLLTPKESLELGLPLDSLDKPAKWFILYLNKPLMTKFSGSVRSAAEELQSQP